MNSNQNLELAGRRISRSSNGISMLSPINRLAVLLASLGEGEEHIKTWDGQTKIRTEKLEPILEVSIELKETRILKYKYSLKSSKYLNST